MWHSTTCLFDDDDDDQVVPVLHPYFFRHASGIIMVETSEPERRRLSIVRLTFETVTIHSCLIQSREDMFSTSGFFKANDDGERENIERRLQQLLLSIKLSENLARRRECI